MTKLAEALDQLGAPSTSNDGWTQRGFLRNPYPTRASPIWDVFHNQAAVRDQFYSEIVQFLKDPAQTTTMFFTGGNRVGKTHFMEYHRRALPAELADRNVVLPTAVVSAEFAHLERFYLDVVDQVMDSLHQQTGSALFDAPMANPNELDPGDFRRAMETFLGAQGAHQQHVRTLITGWVRGERLRQTQRSQLGVYGLVDSPSQVQNTFGGLVRFLRSRTFGSAPGQVRTCPGILVFVDEFELVWNQRRDRRDQFLQGLRALVDECALGGLFLCVGMATGLGPEISDVEGDYPALYARLKGHREIPALVEIESGLIGIEYAREFEKYGRNMFLALNPSGTLSPAEIFSNREIDVFFRDMLGSAQSATVTQADFFDRLHSEAEQRLKT